MMTFSYRRALLDATQSIIKQQPRLQQQQGGRLLVSSTNTTQTSSSSSTRSNSTTSSLPLVSWSLDKSTKIGTISLNSPSTYNALTVEMGNEFSHSMHQLQTELVTRGANINAMVLVSQGENAFSAGGNINWLRLLSNNSIQANADIMLSFYQSFLCIRHCIPVPVVAALQGPAVGAGAGLALACDMRVASSETQRVLGFTFSRLGIHAGMGVSHPLPQCCGGGSTGTVNELFLTGKFISAQEAFDLGLVNRLVSNAATTTTVKDEAYALAGEVASQHPVSVRSMVQTLRTQQDIGLQAALLREAYAQATCYARNDWGAGLDAVEERRNPVFDLYHAK